MDHDIDDSNNVVLIPDADVSDHTNESCSDIEIFDAIPEYSSKSDSEGPVEPQTGKKNQEWGNINGFLNQMKRHR